MLIRDDELSQKDISMTVLGKMKVRQCLPLGLSIGKGLFINDVTEKGGGGVPPKGDQKMTGGEGGICKR